MLPTMPQELIDAIVDNVSGKYTLKRCSLVSPQFCHPCQQILFRSLALDDYPPRYSSVLALLNESPHIAGYIKDLRVRLTWVPISDLSHIADFIRLMGKLQEVNRLAVAAICDWDALAPVTPTIVNLIQTGRLTELQFKYIEDLPPAVLILSLATTSTFSLTQVSVASIDEPSEENATTPVIRKLVLSNCKGLGHLLARRQYSPYITHIQTLCVKSDLCSHLMAAVGQTLEHIELDCSAIQPLPSLANLHSIDLVIPRTGLDELWLLSAFTIFLDSAPTTLKRLSVIMLDSKIIAENLQMPLLGKLDIILAACISAPCVCWKVSFTPDEDGQQVSAFRQIVETGMPRLLGNGKVTVEQMEDVRKWPWL
ncbi:hypothetical protein C8R47DRAFT_1110938 [Mycena vitilis]|nr:hypothetical protein C8R47DRAFT_1110938 [Mycena vitilis]